ncbi:MAG TPA: PAS domain S-box protein [Candidatus Eisenbacteria bacterium]|nr:PAS domain S-box protein [Candidatus Eisenbacteria bacterium]
MDLTRTAFAGISERLLEAMPDAIVIAGGDGRVLLANRRAEMLSGYSREELVGMPVEQLVPEGLRSRHAVHRRAYQRAPVMRAMGTHLDIRFRRRDGSEFPADIALSPLASDQGLLVVASVRDITERKLAEAELLQAQERFRLVVEGVRDHAIFMLDRDGNVSTWSPAAARISGHEAEEVLGRHFSIFYPASAADAGEPERELAEASSAGRFEGEGWRVRKDGSRFWADVEVSPIHDRAGALVGFGKIMRDVTERKRQDDRLRAVLDVAQATLEGRAEHELLQLVAERARALVDADLGVVVLAAVGERALVVAAADGPRAAAVVGSHVPLDGSAAAAVLATGESLVLDDSSRESPAGEPVLAAAGGGPAVLVRLGSGRHDIGGLAATNEPGGRRFTDADRRLLELFAIQAAVTIDYTRVREDLQRLALVEDRERIGRELHDGAIQALFAVGMGLQSMAIMTTDPALRQRLGTAVVQVDEVIRDLRNYIFGLRPGAAADRDLGRALREIAQQFERQHGVACAVDVDPTVAARLSQKAPDIVQAVREALSNVGRHAGAATCRLSVYAEPGMAVVEVDDDGRGFLPAEGDGAGWGLRNLRERAEAMGGSFDIGSVPGEGTTVRLRIPT